MLTAVLARLRRSTWCWRRASRCRPAPQRLPRRTVATRPSAAAAPACRSRTARSARSPPSTATCAAPVTPQRVELDLARAAVPMRVGEYLLAALVGGARALLSSSRSSCRSSGRWRWPSAPRLLRARALRRPAASRARIRAIDDQLVDALTMMANSLKAGASFLQAMEMVARELPRADLASSSRQVVAEIGVGAPVDQALTDLTERVRSYDIYLIVTAMIVQRRVGGNLAEVLDNIAHTIRERQQTVAPGGGRDVGDASLGLRLDRPAGGDVSLPSAQQPALRASRCSWRAPGGCCWCWRGGHADGRLLRYAAHLRRQGLGEWPDGSMMVAADARCWSVVTIILAGAGACCAPPRIDAAEPAARLRLRPDRAPGWRPRRRRSTSACSCAVRPRRRPLRAALDAGGASSTIRA